MKAYAKSFNTRTAGASAKAVAKIAMGVLCLFLWLLTVLADQAIRWALSLSMPELVNTVFMFLFFWLGVGGFLDFIPINRAKQLEDRLRDGPVSVSRYADECESRSERRLMRDISEMKRRRLFRSVAVLEDCIVFERAGNARPLMLMADKDMHFSEGRRFRFGHDMLWTPLLMGLYCYVTGAYALMWAVPAAFGVTLVLSMLRRPGISIAYRKTQMPVPQEVVVEMPKSGDGAADALIDAAAEQIRELTLLDHAIHDEYVSERIREISTATRQLIEFLRKNPHKQSQAKQLIEYALPTTIKLLKQYDYLNNQPVKGENISKSMAKIVEMSGTVAQTMKRELDALYAEGTIDIEVDIEVMTNMLNQEPMDFKVE